MSDSRAAAALARKKARDYSKLVAELVDIQPATDASTRPKPSLDPAHSKANAASKPPSKPLTKPRGGASPPGAASSRPSRPSGNQSDLEARSAALNSELKRKEKSLQTQMSSADEGDIDGLLRVRSDLSAVYIGAIRSKVELLDDICAAKDQPQPTSA